MNWIELAATALGLINVVLIVLRSQWNYPFGLMMVSLYALIFWEARLYGESGLQLFFFIAQLWGWWLWRGTGNQVAAVPVRWLDWNSRAGWLAAIAALGLSFAWIMDRFTSAAAPFVDGPITAASIAAQLLLAFRRVENWILWIVIDIASIGLYVWRGLYPTAGLYIVFLGLSILGLWRWMVAAKEDGELA
jgi:nicotinamide mononucleotide transporter